MKIGRITIKLTKPESFWFHKGACGCYLIGLKFLWVEILGTYCYSVERVEYWKEKLEKADRKLGP